MLLSCSPINILPTSPAEPQCSPASMACRQQLSAASESSGVGRSAPVVYGRQLHRGPTSTVHYAHHVLLQRPVVVKAYDRKKLSPRHSLYIEREIETLQLLRSNSVSGVVCLIETYTSADEIVLVFEPCMLGDLYQVLHSNSRTLDEDFVCRQVVIPLLQVLEQLHSMHIVHRDIKPENLLFDAAGALLVGDFGLAVNQLAERPCLRMGTLDYMCPEVLSQPSAEEAEAQRLLTCELPTYSEKVDIWSVGVLVFELLSGKTPFEVDDISQTASNIMHNRRAPFPAGMSQECQDFVQAALTRDTGSRPSAQQLLAQPWVQQHMLGVDCYAVVTLAKAGLGKEQQQAAPSGQSAGLPTTPEAQRVPCSRAGWAAPAAAPMQQAWRTPAMMSTSKKTGTRSRFAA